MPRAFDRGVPPVDKNPLISGTNYSDPQGIIGDAAGFFGQQVREGIPTVIRDITGIDITGVVEFMDWIVAQFGELFNLANWLEIIQPILDLFDQLIADVGTDTFPIVSELVTFLSGLFDGAGSVLDWLEGIVPFNLPEVLGQFETFLTALTNRETWLTTLQTLIDALTSITNFPSWVTILKTIVNGLLGLGESPLADLTAWLSWLWGLFTDAVSGDLVDSILKPIFEFFKWLFGTLFAGAIPALEGIFTALQKAVSTTGSMTAWINQIPLVGPLVSILTQLTPADGVALDLTTLGAWARKVLTNTSEIPAGNLRGLLPAGILSSIPIANINIDSANLLSQGDFGSSETIDAANGWEWDSSQNYSGTGGCAKVTANGTLRELFSNQVIKVTAGDRINLSAYVKTSGFSGGSTSIQLSLIPFVGTARYTVSGSPVTITFNSRGAATEWTQATGSAGANPVTAPWTVPATVTSVRVRLAITSAATSGSVWFDDINLHKTGLLGQSLVEYLLNAWEGMWNGLVGTSGAGKTWSDMLTAASFLRNFAGGTDLNLTTLGTNLSTAPASVIGSLFSVLFDGTKTVGDFLRLLYNALNKSTSTTPKTVDNVATAAAALQQEASLAKENADQAVLDAAQALIDAESSFDATTNLRTTLISGYTVITATSSTTWTKPAGITDLWVALFSAGQSGSSGSSSGLGGSGTPGGGSGVGGSGGQVIATQLNPTSVGSTVTVTVGIAGSPTTSFGSIVSTTSAYAAYVATPLGLLASSSAPSGGGNGGTFNPVNTGTSAGSAGQSTTAAVTGGNGGAGGSTSGSVLTFAASPGVGGKAGLNFGLSQTGGSGGGGGGGAGSASGSPRTGGQGGNGGFPGGGGGGGGDGFSGGGAGGIGGAGLALIIYKTANTVV